MSWTLALKIFGPIITVGLFIWLVFSIGSDVGASKVQKQWDKQKAADAAMVEKAKTQNAADEAAHREQDRRISDELVAAKEKAAAGNSANELALAGRLRDSDKRAALYRSQAEAGAVERANLAGHAAELDRLLSESLGLLEEGRVLVELRDGQIRALASQINNDRQLISGQSTANEDAAVHAQ